MRRCNVIRGVGTTVPATGTDYLDRLMGRESQYPIVDPATGIRYRVLEDGTCLRDTGMLQVMPVARPCPPGIIPPPKYESSTNTRAFSAIPWLIAALVIAMVVR